MFRIVPRSPRRGLFNLVLASADHVFIAVFLVIALSVSAAHAQGDPKLVRPGEATSGVLLLPSSQDGLYVQAPLIATDVDIAVSGPMARTRVTQRFENSSDQWIEGIYVFPLPDEAAVDTMIAMSRSVSSMRKVKGPSSPAVVRRTSVRAFPTLRYSFP